MGKSMDLSQPAGVQIPASLVTRSETLGKLLYFSMPQIKLDCLRLKSVCVCVCVCVYVCGIQPMINTMCLLYIS